jgi:serine protease Do
MEMGLKESVIFSTFVFLAAQTLTGNLFFVNGEGFGIGRKPDLYIIMHFLYSLALRKGRDGSQGDDFMRLNVCNCRCLVPATVLAVALLYASGTARCDDVAEAIKHAKSLSRAFRAAAESTTPSVVTLIAKIKPPFGRSGDELRELLRDPRFRRLFPDGTLPDGIPDDDDSELPELPNVTSQIGSGVIVDPQGTILTNHHVVEGADEIVVRFADGREVEAAEIKTDPLSDLAVVRVETRKRLPAARLGDSSQLNIGDWVIAIGSPFELEATVSAGIISGKGRGIAKIRRGKLLQTDAAINPGNSGGPLVNLDGEVVGVNTAIASISGGYQGIGFAIPVNRAKWVSKELLAHGEVRRAYLGIHIDELTPEAAEKLNLDARSGVFVANVINDSPADKAGLRTNDVIVEFAGERVRSPRDLQDVVEQKPIDSQQILKVMRDGKPIAVTVTLEPLRE